MKPIIFATLNLVDLMKLGSGMDAAEHSAYVRLVCAHYNQFHDGLPDDDQRLCLIAGCASLKVWMRVRERVLSEFARVEGPGGKGKYVVESVLEGISQIKSRSTDNSAKARERWKKVNAPALPQQSRGNAKTPDSSKRSLQTPDSSASPPAHEAPPEGAGGGESANKLAGEEEFAFCKLNGRMVPRRVGNAVWDDQLQTYVGGDTQQAKKPAKKVAPVAVPDGPKFRVMDHLDDTAQRKAREAAPGWDLYRLAEIYDGNIAKGTHEVPRNANTAFPGWCKRYTGGRPPGAERRAA